MESSAVGAVVGRARSAAWGASLVADLPGGERGAAALFDASTDDLVEAGMRLDMHVSDAEPGARVFGPVVDGDLLPEHPLEAFRAGRSDPVPLVIGTNADEGTLFQLFRGLRATPARLERFFAEVVAETRDPILDAYPWRRPRRRPTSRRGRRAMAGFVTDMMFWHPSVVVAEGHAAVAPVWMYRFDFTPRLMRLAGMGAMHGAELDHVFGRDRSRMLAGITLLGGRRAARALMRRTHARWIAFAERGTLDDGWPRFDPRDRRILVLDTSDRVEADPGAAVREAWNRWQYAG